jgi:indole-3-glycerol phosphate synthase
MKLLDAIIEHKRIEVMKRRRKRPLSELNDFPFYGRSTHTIDLAALKGKPGIIAEFKRKSPSLGNIRMEADPVVVAEGYRSAGAVAMSILTDRDFFGGSFRDLSGVRSAQPDFPLLRKDFIIDPYQVHEASAYGADMILLIAAILEKSQVADLAVEAKGLGLDVLFEVHRPDELEKYDPSIAYVGVNNRDLNSLRVDTSRSMELAGKLPSGVTAVSESGISSREEIKKLTEAGFSLFLIGEHFMRQQDPGLACRKFIEDLMRDG